MKVFCQSLVLETTRTVVHIVFWTPANTACCQSSGCVVSVNYAKEAKPQIM